METTEVAPETDDKTLLKPWFIICGCVILALLVGLAYLFLLHDPDDGVPVPNPLTASETCDLPDSDQTSITGIPETGWHWIGEGEAAVAVPRTPDHGPATITDGVPSCWARSPLGAVSAAAAVAALGSTGMEHTLYRDLTLEGPERDALLAETPEDTEPFGDGVNLVAFRLVDYTRDEATVTIVASNGEAYIAGTYGMAYEGGDWKYDPPTSLEPQFSEPATLDGYNEFRGGPTDG